MTKVYVETSALGNYLDDRSPRQRDAIRGLILQIKEGKLQGITSELTLEEVQRAAPWLSERLSAVVEESGMLVLPVTPETRALAAAYVQAGIVPLEFQADALHVAIAVLAGADVIASHNLKHLANPRVVSLILNLNSQHGLPSLDIRTPEALL